MKTIEQRINTIIGQLEGVKRMVSDDKKCVEILTQIKAVKSAIDGLTLKMLEDNIHACVGEGKKTEELKKLISELTK